MTLAEPRSGLAVAAASMLFSLWVTFTAGDQSAYQAMLLLLIGIPVYGFLKARRERRGEVAEPVELASVAGEPVR